MSKPYRNIAGALTLMGAAYVYVNRAKFLELAKNLNLDTYINKAVDKVNETVDSGVEATVEQDQRVNYDSYIKDRIKDLDDYYKAQKRDQRSKELYELGAQGIDLLAQVLKKKINSK